jgi:hypothetical protein
MRNIIVIIAILIMLLPDQVKKNLDLFDEDLEAVAYAGLMTYIPTSSKPEPEPEPEPKQECKCNKRTGKISYDGGTSLTDCECSNGTNNCGCVHSNKGASEVTEKFPRVVLITHVKSCLPCRNIERDVLKKLTDESHKKSGWVVSNTRDANVQVLDLSEPDSIAEIENLKLPYSSIPTFYFLSKDGSKKMAVGYMSYSDFIAFAQTPKKK